MNMSEKAAYDNKSAKMPNMIAKAQRRGSASGIAKIKRGRQSAVGDQAALTNAVVAGLRGLKSGGVGFFETSTWIFCEPERVHRKRTKTISRTLQEGQLSWSCGDLRSARPCSAHLRSGHALLLPNQRLVLTSREKLVPLSSPFRCGGWEVSSAEE